MGFSGLRLLAGERAAVYLPVTAWVTPVLQWVAVLLGLPTPARDATRLQKALGIREVPARSYSRTAKSLAVGEGGPVPPECCLRLTLTWSQTLSSQGTQAQHEKDDVRREVAPGICR